MKPPVRTSAHLREMLFQEMEKVQSGQSDPQISASMCRLSSEIVRTVRLELEYAREIRASGDATATVSPIDLGTPMLGVQAAPKIDKKPDEPQTRNCLKCRKFFKSIGASNRICEACFLANQGQPEVLVAERSASDFG